MDIGEDEHFQPSMQAASGLTRHVIRRDFMRGGAVTRRDGATADARIPGKQIIR